MRFTPCTNQPTRNWKRRWKWKDENTRFPLLGPEKGLSGIPPWPWLAMLSLDSPSNHPQIAFSRFKDSICFPPTDTNRRQRGTRNKKKYRYNNVSACKGARVSKNFKSFLFCHSFRETKKRIESVQITCLVGCPKITSKTWLDQRNFFLWFSWLSVISSSLIES